MNRHSRPPVKTSAAKTAIDWNDVRRRLVAANAALNEEDESAPEAMEQIWARRAARLAQAPAPADEGEQMQVVLLRLGREVYGLDVRYASDIHLAENIARVPRVPDWAAGVVNLRGRIFSVVDLRRYLGLGRAEAAECSPEAACYLVVVETPDMEVALLADEVLPMETVPIDRIQDAASAIRGLRPEYLRGIAERPGGGSMVILDLPALLADKQLIVHKK
jgi:purine-binding chemotaxis protein CheW